MKTWMWIAAGAAFAALLLGAGLSQAARRDAPAPPHTPALLADLAERAQPLEWVALDGACFTMGEDRVHREERPTHRACVDGFSIARTEITNAQFAAFVLDTDYVTRAERGAPATGDAPETPPGSAVFVGVGDGGAALNPWAFVPGSSWLSPDGQSPLSVEAAGWPVVHVAAEDARAFARWSGGRLPSEAEWEYAARGGLEGELYAWDEAEHYALAQKANTWQGVFPLLNTGADGHRGAAPVGQYPPNGFGLHDMIGNVWELTSTPYHPHHRDAATGASPQGPATDASGAPVTVIKGGSYLCHRNFCYRYRPAARQPQDDYLSTSHVGFRIVRDAPPAAR